jgi:hypothetical protein
MGDANNQGSLPGIRIIEFGDASGNRTCITYRLSKRINGRYTDCFAQITFSKSVEVCHA